MTSVLVVGGAGFIGTHLLRRIGDDGGAVFATCRKRSGVESLPGVTWVETDVTSPGAAARWPKSCDTVIYLAQSRQWRAFPDGAHDTFQVNVAAVVAAAEYARMAGAKRFIYLSSGSVYPKTDGEIGEDHRFEVPSNRAFYPSTKLAAEMLLAPYSVMFPVIVQRLFVPYGAGQDPKMLLPQLVRCVQAGEPITLDGEDGLRINPIAIADVIEALIQCAGLDRTITMNVAGPETLTLREVAVEIGRHVGREPVLDRRPGTTAASIVGDTSLLAATLGWTPSRTLSEGLGDWLG